MTRPARARRTWQQWAGLVLLLVVGFVIWATVHDRQEPPRPLSSLLTTDPATPFSAPTPTPQAHLSAVDAAKQHDKGWVLETYRAGGSGTITARVKNANPSTSTAFFTMTLLNGGRPVATWHGSADGVLAGSTVTVTLVTADTVPAGVKADEMQFQTDTSVATG